jgi:hypothetical protein
MNVVHCTQSFKMHLTKFNTGFVTNSISKVGQGLIGSIYLSKTYSSHKQRFLVVLGFELGSCACQSDIL